MRAIWARAAEQAATTDASRNRVVDLLRAISILVVVIGHWLMAAPEITPDGDLLAGHVLAEVPWTQWLTWLFQVMPVFFMVGGYANAASWDATKRRGEGYGVWLHARLRRLALPVLPLLAFWALLAWSLLAGGLDPELVVVGSQTALVPVWFLAVYIGVVALTPVTIRVWDRMGIWSIVAGSAVAMAIDAISLGLGEPSIGWANYLFIWGTIHQIGYAWRAGRLGPGARCALAAVGLLGLMILVGRLGYPVSMVGVPGAEVNNTLPPRLPLLGLGLMQSGMLLLLEGRMKGFLAGRRAWTATVLVNSMIMTLYLWHLTAMVLLLAVLLAFDGFGLHLAAGTGVWWMTRPLWLLVATTVATPIVLPLSRFERPRSGGPAPSALRGVTAVAFVCVGLALLAYRGVGGPDGVNWAFLGLPFIGAVVGGLIDLRRSSASA